MSFHFLHVLYLVFVTRQLFFHFAHDFVWGLVSLFDVGVPSLELRWLGVEPFEEASLLFFYLIFSGNGVQALWDCSKDTHIRFVLLGNLAKHFSYHLQLFWVGILMMANFYFLLFKLPCLLFFLYVIFLRYVVSYFLETDFIGLVLCFVVFFMLC